MAERSRDRAVEAMIVDDAAIYTLREVCEVCGVYAERIVELVDYGVAEPRGRGDTRDWRFDAGALFRLRRALHLCDDLGVNFAGACLALDLLEELERLRREVDRLSRLGP